MEVVLEVLHRHCAGLDVHKASLTACIRIVDGKSVTHEIREFGTTVRALGALRDWLHEHAVKAVVMEATGVYWKPVWHLLEADFELTLANAGHVKNVRAAKRTSTMQPGWLICMHMV
jgi:transposase